MVSLANFLRILVPPVQGRLAPVFRGQDQADFASLREDRIFRGQQTAAAGIRMRIWPRAAARRRWNAGIWLADQAQTGPARWTGQAASIVDDAVVGCTTDGRIAHWSPGAETLFGMPADAAVGRMIDTLAPAEHLDILHRMMRDIVAGGPGRRVEAVMCHCNGTLLTVMLGAAASRNADGAVLGVSLFVREVTELRRMAAELAAAQTRLAVMRKQLSQMTRLTTLERMTLDLAHELNQPLAAIGNYLRAGQRLISGKPEPDLERLGVALDGAMKQSQHAGRIVGGVRAFVLRGETEKQLESAAALVQEAVALTAPMIEEHKIQVALDLDSAIVSLLVDRVQIVQVLINLIRNASEAMQDSPRRQLSIASRWVDGAVEIAVTDTGKGLPEALRDHLFEPFLTTRNSGTGLGLTICHLIVEAHGGRLSCRSAPEGGSIFCFSVPGMKDLPP